MNTNEQELKQEKYTLCYVHFECTYANLILREVCVICNVS
jgi:hypothetical protein